jgi:hypothetical protein
MASVPTENGGFSPQADHNAPTIPPQGDVTPTSSDLDSPTDDVTPTSSDSESPVLPQGVLHPTPSEDLESPMENRRLFEDVEASQRQQDALDMDEVLGEIDEVGDTDSVNSSDEAKDLGEAVEEAFRDTLMLLVKEDDDVEASASPNWIMKKGIGEI